MFYMILSLDGMEIRQYAFEKEEILIGRDPSCDIAIDNLGVSRNHARISHPSGLLVDLESANHVFVNDQRISSIILKDGDLISIGRYKIKFLLKAATTAAPVAQINKPWGNAEPPPTFKVTTSKK